MIEIDLYFWMVEMRTYLRAFDKMIREEALTKIEERVVSHICPTVGYEGDLPIQRIVHPLDVDPSRSLAREIPRSFLVSHPVSQRVSQRVSLSW